MENMKIFLLFIKDTKKGKQSNEKETKTRILLLQLTITREKKKSSRKNQKEGKENKLLLEF
jgi:hypothetical protein